MHETRISAKGISIDEQALKETPEEEVLEDEFTVVDDTPEFGASVEQESQVTVDSNHPGGMVQDVSHLTLAQRERIRACEAELDHFSEQAGLRSQDGWADRTRKVIVNQRRERRRERQEPDPRDRLSREALSNVNREAGRIADRVAGGPTRETIARKLADRVGSGQSIHETGFETLDKQKGSPGVLLPIAEVLEVRVGEVNVEGEIVELWEPSTRSIQQVGLIADETGTIMFTIWPKSQQPEVREDQRVRFRAAMKNWYQCRCLIALAYESRSCSSIGIYSGGLTVEAEFPAAKEVVN